MFTRIVIKGEFRMKKEKREMKLWKKILIVIVIILIIFVGITLRKLIILNDIDNKVSKLENNNDNIYIEVIVNNGTHISKLTRFIKDNIDKVIVENIDNKGEKTTTIQITYPNQRKVFTEKDGMKVMSVYDETAPKRGAHIENTTSSSYSSIVNFAYNNSIPEKILDSVLTNIKDMKMDEKQCYELSSLYNSNFMYSENKKEIKAYIEKDTGLPIKLIEVVNENGKNVENVTTYKYQFNIVTDEDMQEPNNQEYTLQR